MGKFEEAVEYVLKNEGGYSNHPKDAGGPTNWGIILAVLKQEGMAGDLDFDGDVDADDIRLLTRDQAIGIYKRQWWDRFGYQGITHNIVATKIFDCAVNMGQAQAAKNVQRALLACDISVKIDGIMGPKTRIAINSISPYVLRCAFRSEMAGIYRLILAKHPDYADFEVGWLRRAYQ